MFFLLNTYPPQSLSVLRFFHAPTRYRTMRSHKSFVRLTIQTDPRLYVCQAPNAFVCVSLCGSIQRETLMDDYADEMRLKNILNHEEHVTQTSRGATKLRALYAMLTGGATCACKCSCTCCCSLCHACPHCSCCCSGCKYTVFVANFL